MIQIDELLKLMVKLNASDLHLKAMRPPLLRIDGVLQPIDHEKLRPDVLEKTLVSLLRERHREELENHNSVDVGYSVPGISRFRINIFMQRSTFGAVFRRVPMQIPSIDDWGLPDVIKDLSKLNQGLVLVTGPTGSGKSSTLAAIIRLINETRFCHVLTIEDPIEFLFRDNMAAISQREIGMDTPSFQHALRNALRQDPDVIMVGEMRDQPTMETAITASETGHLVFSTLHTNSASQSIDRILDTFPANQHKQVRNQLSLVLKAILSLSLLPVKDSSGRIAAVEIMRNSPVISKMITENRIAEIDEEMAKSVNYYKMQTMNQSLISLIVHGRITMDTAMKASPNQEELDLALRKIYFSGKQAEGGTMGDSHSDYSKIEELLESKRLLSDLQEKFKFEVESRDSRIRDMEGEVRENSERLQQAFQQLDRLLKEKDSLQAEKDKLRDFYEKKLASMRKQFQERLNQGR